MLRAVPLPVGPTTITTLIGVAAATVGTATMLPRLSTAPAMTSARAPTTNFDALWAPLLNKRNVLPPHYLNAAGMRRTLNGPPGRVGGERGWARIAISAAEPALPLGGESLFPRGRSLGPRAVCPPSSTLALHLGTGEHPTIQPATGPHHPGPHR